MAGSPVLKAIDLGIGYASKKGNRVIARSLDLELQKGELVCLVGPNGVGKSTLVRTLAGVQPCLEGKVLVGEKEIHHLASLERARKIGLVLTDSVEMEGFSVFDVVALGRFPHTDWRGILDKRDHLAVWEALELVGALDLGERKLSQLSDGERQKVMIARALAQEAEMIILDEPTSFLDLLRKVEVLNILRSLAWEQNKAVLMALHEIPLSLQFADLVWLFRPGEGILAGTPEELVLSGRIVETFSSPEHVFDPLSGTYPAKATDSIPLYLKGSGPPALWTVKALERQGIFQAVEWKDDPSGVYVEVLQRKDSIEWVLSVKGEKETFISLYQLLKHLKVISSNLQA
ncbi:MAG: ABC transporter ATP-binding protein [Synergistales bacterium]|nr:ABC transporter ATP-binding protein [Synergistales bacterium]